nr:zinc finger protein 704 isoform X3 [Camelus dromedarius]
MPGIAPKSRVGPPPPISRKLKSSRLARQRLAVNLSLPSPTWTASPTSSEVDPPPSKGNGQPRVSEGPRGWADGSAAPDFRRLWIGEVNPVRVLSARGDRRAARNGWRRGGRRWKIHNTNSSRRGTAAVGPERAGPAAGRMERSAAPRAPGRRRRRRRRGSQRAARSHHPRPRPPRSTAPVAAGRRRPRGRSSEAAARASAASAVAGAGRRLPQPPQPRPRAPATTAGARGGKRRKRRRGRWDKLSGSARRRAAARSGMQARRLPSAPAWAAVGERRAEPPAPRRAGPGRRSAGAPGPPAPGPGPGRARPQRDGGHAAAAAQRRDRPPSGRRGPAAALVSGLCLLLLGEEEREEEGGSRRRRGLGRVQAKPEGARRRRSDDEEERTRRSSSRWGRPTTTTRTARSAFVAWAPDARSPRAGPGAFEGDQGGLRGKELRRSCLCIAPR